MKGKMKGNQKLRVLKISTVAIASVVAVEITLGLAVGSLAILSDGTHALLDASSTLVLLLATGASLKPPDEEHMYGHEKIEPIGGLVGGLILLVTGVFLAIESVLRLMANTSYIVQQWELAGFAAIGYTFCIDILRVTTMRRGERQSATLKAGFYHALADLGSTLIAFLGFGLATLGFYMGDALASMVLSVMIGYLSVRLIWGSGMELSDSVSRDVAGKVRREIVSTKDVLKWKDLKIRRVGDKTFVRATVQVPDYLSLEDAHNLASKIEERIKKSLGNTDVAIHTEPYEAEMPTERLVEKIAEEVRGVIEAHEISLASQDGGLYVTLHAQVDPNLSVQKSHKIAERIEERVKAQMRNVENVTVHVEPFDVRLRKGSVVDEGEIRKIVQMASEEFKQTFRIKRMLTYVAEKRRFINIDCSFSGEPSIKAAHELASYIEEKLEERFAETTVTVHIEPEKKGKA